MLQCNSLRIPRKDLGKLLLEMLYSTRVFRRKNLGNTFAISNRPVKLSCTSCFTFTSSPVQSVTSVDISSHLFGVRSGMSLGA